MGVDSMASVTKLDSAGRQGFRIRFYVDDRRREIYLAGCGKRVERRAEIIARHCDELAKAKSNSVAPSAESIAWASSVEGRLRDNLVAWGLADPVTPKLSTDQGRLLSAFLSSYIESRTDVKRTTTINYNQTKRVLVEYFGPNKPLKSITKADAERWRRWMLAKPMAIATVSKHGKRAKTMLAEAVKDRLLSESPFADLKGADESNTLRQRFIGPAIVTKVLEACPDADWRLIFTLARFGGLRCPSEVLGLKWTDVDRSGNQLRIDSPKTGLRFVPIFPEIAKALDDSWDAAPEGAVYCVSRYRDKTANLRTQLGRILENAKVEQWPKLFVNLRSTRRTELQESFPDHVVNKWLGHSGKVAEKHYLQVTDEHWGAAAVFRSPTGSPIAHHLEPSGPIHETTKPSNSLGSDGAGWLMIPNLVTPTGVEPVLPP
jgi:integrase